MAVDTNSNFDHLGKNVSALREFSEGIKIKISSQEGCKHSYCESSLNREIEFNEQTEDISYSTRMPSCPVS